MKDRRVISAEDFKDRHSEITGPIHLGVADVGMCREQGLGV